MHLFVIVTLTTNYGIQEKETVEIKTITQGKMYEVTSKENKYIVIYKKMPGRTLILCDCYNGTIFCNEPTFCKHKEAVIIKRYLEKLDNKM